MRDSTLCLLAVALLFALACSEEPAAQPPAPSTTGEQTASGSEQSGSGQPGSAQPGPSPWGNSVDDDDVDDEQCGASAEPAGPACAVNSDCGICHDGSACGRPANRAEIERLGNACRIPDAAECEYAVVRCCSGHCRVTGG